MTDILTGALLVAIPGMLDPNFRRSVVLVCDHTDQGALGVILNRPGGAEVGAYLPGWADRVALPRVVFEGGPVQREVAIGLGRCETTQPVEGWTPVTDRIGLVDLSTDPQLAAGITEVRVFSGYAGWSSGQLETEVAEGGWFVVPSEPNDPFAGAPDRLWSAVLKRQGGALAFYATYPPDPSLN